MKKEVLVFIFDGYADWESAYICSQLHAEETEYTVKTLGLSKEPVVSMGGFRVTPDYSVSQYPAEFSMLLLIGGEAWRFAKNDGVRPVVEYAKKKKIPIGAICNAVNFIADCGYLDAIRHTGNTAAYMKAQAPRYQGEKRFEEKPAVCDANIVTANGTAALEFAREIILLLGIKDVQEAQAWYEQNKIGYYQSGQWVGQHFG